MPRPRLGQVRAGATRCGGDPQPNGPQKKMSTAGTTTAVTSMSTSMSLLTPASCSAIRRVSLVLFGAHVGRRGNVEREIAASRCE